MTICRIAYIKIKSDQVMDNIFLIFTLFKVSIFFSMMFSMSLLMKKHLLNVKDRNFDFLSIIRNDKTLFLINVILVILVVILCFI